MLSLRLVGRRRRAWRRGIGGRNRLVAFFLSGLIDGHECQALWSHGLLVIDEGVLDRARVLEAIGETVNLRPYGPKVTCCVDTQDPCLLMSTLARAIDHLHCSRVATADQPEAWKAWVRMEDSGSNAKS